MHSILYKNRQTERITAMGLLQGAKFDPFLEVGPLNCILLNQCVRGVHSREACHRSVDR